MQQANPQQILDAIGRLPLDELMTVADGVSRLRARRLAPTLSEKETELLAQIEAATLDSAERSRLHELGAKLEAENITAAERDEMLQLNDKSEALNVERLTAVQKLAILRGHSFRAVMTSLGLLSPHG